MAIYGNNAVYVAYCVIQGSLRGDIRRTEQSTKRYASHWAVYMTVCVTLGSAWRYVPNRAVYVALCVTQGSLRGAMCYTGQSTWRTVSYKTVGS